MSNNPVYDTKMRELRQALDAGREDLVAQIYPLLVKLFLTVQVVDGLPPKMYRIDTAFTRKHGNIYMNVEQKLNEIKRQFWQEQREENEK